MNTTIKRRVNWVKKNWGAVLLACVFLILGLPLLVRIFGGPDFLFNARLIEALRLGDEDVAAAVKHLGFFLSGLIALGAIYLSNRRAKAMEENIRQTERGHQQERFRDAITHLGHSSDSVQLGGVHGLIHLALEDTDRRANIVGILCHHICASTGEEPYQKKYQKAPATKIQKLLSLLFCNEETQHLLEDAMIDLRGAYLRGADLREAKLRGTSLAGAQLQGADLWEAQLQGADLWEAQLQGATLWGAQLQGADLAKAQLQGATLWRAQLQGATLVLAQLQGADLAKAQLQGANLAGAQLQGIYSTGSVESFRKPFSGWIQQGIGRKTDLTGVTFSGGLDEAAIEAMYGGDELQTLKEKLIKNHTGPARHDLPEDSYATIGAYTQEEAERWIKKYEKIFPPE